MLIIGLGALFLGLTVGWIVYRILRLRAGFSGLSDIIAIVGVIGGAVALALFRIDILFGWYAIGLAVGFFAYFGVGFWLYGKREVQPWLPEPPPPTSTPQIMQPWLSESIPPTSNPDPPLEN
jgi:O-antigen/teichoic acid export membrane protein